MKSLLATNSGKLIAVISSDLFTIERSLGFLPLLLIFVFVNALAYTMIGILSSWTNSLIVFCVWLLMLSLQVCSGKASKYLKGKEGALTDWRLKLVNDMVVGIRTLKCYGWEHHYLDKVKNVRQKHVKFVFVINLL